MDRRDFLKAITAGGSTAALFSILGERAAYAAEHEAKDAAAAAASPTAAGMESLRVTLAEIEAGFAAPAWRLQPTDLPEARRYLLHTLQHALEVMTEADPAYPFFARFVTPEKKLLGDNPDAVYFHTAVSADHSYRIQGNVADATYTSLTVENLSTPGGEAAGLGATLNDTEFEIAADGSYEILVSATEQKGNWLKLDERSVSITTRHYYERETSVAADRLHHIPIMIETTDAVPPRPSPSEASIAAGIAAVETFLRGVIVPPQGPDEAPRWVSTVPNQFPAPKIDTSNEEIGFAAKDNVYSMAPFLVKPGEALVVRGRFPACRFANVVLWNRFIQTLDYTTRTTSLNRKQVTPEADGSFKIVIAGEDPGVPNWIDTEGRMLGTAFWRFMLPEGQIEPLTSQVVPLAKVEGA